MTRTDDRARAQFSAETSATGALRRQGIAFPGRITADGRGGFKAGPGRYHLYVSLAPPWAHRAPIFGETTNFDHIKHRYYQPHEQLNPARILPKGPAVDWLAPHDRGGRSRLGGA